MACLYIDIGEVTPYERVKVQIVSIAGSIHFLYCEHVHYPIFAGTQYLEISGIESELEFVWVVVHARSGLSSRIIKV